ncbi:uncharacterized protein PRCAT00006277001 [Priceomyces carsonii]|uniref:uncharacterized protein n=1 Tax=Priceomyces carsonii TaxID=28549 RepID=UPI002ED8741D|nr:unnamed protein product [Priceomyces carsonii]
MLTESNTMAELYGSGSEEISPGNTSRASSSADPTFERFDYDLGGENIQGNSPLNYLEMPLVKNIDSYITSSPNEPNSDKS